MEDPGPPCRWEMQLVGVRHPLHLVRSYSFSGQAWAEGKGGLATCRLARTANDKM